MKNYMILTLMNELTGFLKLDKFSFDLVNPEYKYSKNITFEYDNIDFAREIGKYKKTIYEQFRSEKKFLDSVKASSIDKSPRLRPPPYVKVFPPRSRHNFDKCSIKSKVRMRVS